MRIQHKRRGFTGTIVFAARELEFVDGVAEIEDNTALAAACNANGFHVLDDEPAAEAEKPKRARKPKPEHELTADVELTEQAGPELTDDLPDPPSAA